MIFSSVIFLFYFLPIVLAAYFLLGKRCRNAVLLIASIIFYAWGEPKLVLILGLSVVVNYLFGMALLSEATAVRKAVVTGAVIFNIGILFLYKYLDFSITVINDTLRFLRSDQTLPLVGLALPIGLSFFTFQGLSYVIDVYRKKVPVQKNPMHVALYISMFPQLVAGPIVRYETIEREITARTVTLNDVYEGVQRFILGLGKKVLIADVLAYPADLIFDGGLDQLTTSKAWLGVLCYTLQIYFDFSGYSDMAIGLGRIFGFHYLENFDYPYTTTSITGFWRKWHISLSSWFRDYLYIPMGGNRRGNVYLHLIVVFLCTGIWHGAAFTFLFWGIWHGAFILAERILKQKGITPKLPAAVGWLYTMLVVSIGWMFFRVDTLRHGISYLWTLFGKSADGFIQYTLPYYLTPKVAVVFLVGTLASLGVFRRIYEKTKHLRGFEWMYQIFLLVVLFFSITSVVNGNYSPFIYFRF